MAPYLTSIVGVFSLVTILLFYLANLHVAQNLSPQGCRMSWMSPSYVLQNGFDSSWSPLARRYSLWLYREVGWDSNQIQGVPVLFIPGNAGSSHQVRSIASSATRQFYSSPQVVAPEFSSGLKPLDFFAAEFNEDLSAFHGSTIESQIWYTTRAVDYILSLYPVNTSIIIMGHSMGGIVAISLLPSAQISAIITMSTPHVLPPARFDSRIDELYRKNKIILDTDPTPILSLCGGATDLMIPSESCVLQEQGADPIFRRTIFTSALEGAWTGVGHREIVWCHQVRWRVARAALEVGAGASSKEKGGILDVWLRDGHSVPRTGDDGGFSLPNSAAYKVLPMDTHLILKKPHGSEKYLLPLPKANTSASVLKAVIFVSQGSIPPVSPQNRIPLQVTVFYCALSPVLEEAGPICNPLQPSSLRLIPNPVPGKPFPVPDEGSDESEGVVLYEADIPAVDDERPGKRWLGVRLADADGRGWVVAGFSSADSLIGSASTMSLLTGKTTVMLPDKNALRIQVAFPNLLSSALLIYRVTPRRAGEDPDCLDPLFSPLIVHTSQPSETHYYPIGSPDRRILLHTHISAPYVPRLSASESKALDFIIYSSGSTGCADLVGFTIELDWFATLGRWGSRYLTTLVSWAVGVVAFVLFEAWGLSDKFHAMPTVHQSLSTYSSKPLRKLMLASFLISFLPLPVEYYLGNEGDILFAPIAPLLLFIASGLVFVSWWVLVVLMWPLGKVGILLVGRHRRYEERSVRRSTIISIIFIFLLIFLFVPWQVAYVGCWCIHLFTCATLVHLDPLSSPASSHAVHVIPLIRVRDTDDDAAEDEEPIEITNCEAQRETSPHLTYTTDNRNHNMHLLLLMTWLLPLAAPVLAVWVRTLVTAGLTTPFDGDHVFLNVAPFLVLVDFASWYPGALFERRSFESTLSVRWCFAFIAGVAFFVGPRKAYAVFDVAKVAVGLIVVIRVGRRYWGGESWSVDAHR
ncbi:PGAP1-domain-containing protein [Tricholoma matsutake]|nr:PGAP1-domain-containing protein [Tricholoma matsutake 945]